MNGLSTDTKNDMLIATLASRAFMVALYTGDEEIVDALYQRRTAQFSDPTGEGDVRFVQNAEVVRFEGFAGRHTIDHWAIIDVSGQMRARYRLVDAIEVSPVMDCKFRVGELRIGLP